MHRLLILVVLSALTCVSCGLYRQPPPEPAPAVYSPDCPIVDAAPDADATPDASEAHGIFHEAPFAFIADVYSRHVVLHSGGNDVATRDEAQAAQYEAHARSLLTDEYKARLSKLEDARLPLHSGSSHTDFSADSLSTDIRDGQATQKIVYCVGDGSIWTQVFHLERIDDRWRIDEIERAVRR